MEVKSFLLQFLKLSMILYYNIIQFSPKDYNILFMIYIKDLEIVI